MWLLIQRTIPTNSAVESTPPISGTTMKCHHAACGPTQRPNAATATNSAAWATPWISPYFLAPCSSCDSVLLGAVAATIASTSSNRIGQPGQAAATQRAACSAPAAGSAELPTAPVRMVTSPAYAACTTAIIANSHQN
jgi:hypothetical protein